MYKFRVIIGTDILTNHEDRFYACVFGADSLSNARRKATSDANEVLFHHKGIHVSWGKWVFGGNRRTIRKCKENPKLQIWLVSIDKDYKDIDSRYKQ